MQQSSVIRKEKRSIINNLSFYLKKLGGKKKTKPQIEGNLRSEFHAPYSTSY